MGHPKRIASPAPFEIQQRTKQVRDRGFILEGDYYPPWDEEVFQERAMPSQRTVPFSFPTISLDEIESEGYDLSFIQDAHSLDSGP